MRRRAESPSSIAIYCECPRRYAFKYVEKLPDPMGPAAALGQAFHSMAYETWHLQDIGNCEDPLVCKMLRAMYDHHDVKALPHSQLEEGKTCEYQLKADLGNQTLFGYVDLLLDDVQYAVDFKTSGRPWTKEKVEEQQQHLAYTLGLREIGRSEVKRFLYIVVTTNKNPQCQVITLDVTPEAVQGYHDKFLGAVDMIELDLFPATPCNACRWCPWKNLCPAYKK